MPIQNALQSFHHDSGQQDQYPLIERPGIELFDQLSGGHDTLTGGMSLTRGARAAASRVGHTVFTGSTLVLEAVESSVKARVQAIAGEVNDFIKYYGRDMVKTDDEVAQARDLLHLPGADLPEWLGYNKEQYTTSPNQNGFLKENDPALKASSDKFFKVVRDREGGEWLLKYAGLTSEKADGKDVINDAEALQRAEEEVSASKIAEVLGYPVPETKLTAPEINGDAITRAYKGYIAYRFVPDAMDYSYYSGAADDSSKASLTPISNPEDVAFRPIFNVLVGSHGDGANQGIVSQETGAYYAQDLGVSSAMLYKRTSEQYSNWDEALRSYFGTTAEGIDSGTRPIVAPETREKFDAYFNAIRHLTAERVSEVLSSATPLARNRQAELSRAIAERAQVLTNMYDSGFFDAKKPVID